MKIRIDIKEAGLFTLMIYVFASYICNELMLPNIILQFALYALLAIGVLTAIVYRKIVLLSDAHVQWYLIFLALAAVTVLYSNEKAYLSGDYYRVIVAFVLLFFASQFLTDGVSLKKICWCFAISSLVMCSWLLITGNMIGTSRSRLGGDIFGNANSFALRMMYATMISLWLLVYETSKKSEKILLLVIIAFNLLSLIFSAGRKFFIIPFIFYYLLLVIKQDSKGKRHIIKYTFLFGLLAVIVFVLIMNVELFYNSIGIRIELWLNKYTGAGIVDGSTDIRGKIRALAFNEWTKSPFWGYGFDDFKYICRSNFGYFFYSHCNYTELLYSGGIVLFLSYYIFIFRSALLAWKDDLIEQKYKALAFAVFGCQLIFDFAGVSYNNYMTILVITIASIALRKIGIASNNR